MRTKILKDTVSQRLIEEDVNPDHLTLRIRRANQDESQDEDGSSE